MIDRHGFRTGVAIVLLNLENQVFWGHRVGIQNAWQFPQGGVQDGEEWEEAMYRELYEELGLLEKNVEILSSSRKLLRYRLPRGLIRQYSKPICVGQKQKWYLLRLKNEKIRFDFVTTETPEFDNFRWVDYWRPLKEVINFKKRVYRRALKEFSPIIFTK